MRILALATNPHTAASTRFRVQQWMPHLAAAGYTLTLDAFFSPAAADVLYQPNRRLTKFAYSARGTLRRIAALARAHLTADMLLIHREAFPLGRKVLFSRVERFPGPVIYDYDDAMFLPQRQGRGILARLERLHTPCDVMRRTDLVLAGNAFLADYAKRYASRVMVLPTSIDTEAFRPSPARRDGPQCVLGWIGSHSTAKYLRSLMPVLERVAADVPFVLRVVGIPGRFHAERVTVSQAPWSLEHEAQEFAACDVGLYPLWHDQWTEGKCGFKAIQFMSCGIPVVAAGFGVNREIVQDGVNGFLATTEAEWIEKLGLLLSDPFLRRKLGDAGRRTVEERYSLTANAPLLIRALGDIARRS